ncbi:MAG: acyl-CoA dehydrogenase family protein [Longimicrobiales bacterium]|nr:acyl-CoA dehydrogenase family protein [Longimicrobiales bacterium]
MSDPEPHADYSFDAWLADRSPDWYGDDGLLHRLLDRYAPGTDTGRLARFGPRAAGELRVLAERSSLPSEAPWLRHRDAHDHRVDGVVLPESTDEALRIAHGDEGLGAVRGDRFVHYAMVYLLAQNGEAGVACSIACTDGLVRALRADLAEPGADRPADIGDVHSAPGGDPRRRALHGVLDSGPDGYAHGAQFVTEIQGGSDVPANRVRAVPAPDGPPGDYRIHGQKWFCSNINADWFLVTARPDTGPGAGEVALFLVEARVDGRPNGYTIDRLKDKLGTRELATAEVTFDGARARMVGPPDRGVAFLLRHVLTPSRFACVLFSAGALRRAERLVTGYAGFREAFGRAIVEYPLVRRDLDAITEARRQTLAVSFELLRLWEAAEAAGWQGTEARDFRVLLSLAKPVLTRLATERLHDAMMVLAGNGIVEDFSPLPRLYRDSVIMETWEGPHNVLFTQALRDLARFEAVPEVFLERVAGRPRADLAARLSEAMAAALEPGAVEDGTTMMADLAPEMVAAVADGVLKG